MSCNDMVSVPESSSPYRGWKVLVLDDEPDVVAELCEYLESCGYSTVGATSVADAGQAFEADAALRLLLVDLRMPEQDGLGMIEALQRTHGDSAPFEAMILTGHGGEEDVIRALRLGLADYQRKPLDLAEVGRCVEKLEARLTERHRALVLTSDVAQHVATLSSAIREVNNDVNTICRALGGQDHPLQETEGETMESTTALPSSMRRQLTARQQEVLLLVGRGMSNQQIAYELGISENTVKLHVSQILRNTGMSNRTQLALAVTHGPEVT